MKIIFCLAYSYTQQLSLHFSKSDGFAFLRASFAPCKCWTGIKLECQRIYYIIESCSYETKITPLVFMASPAYTHAHTRTHIHTHKLKQ